MSGGSDAVGAVVSAIPVDSASISIERDEEGLPLAYQCRNFDNVNVNNTAVVTTPHTVVGTTLLGTLNVTILYDLLFDTQMGETKARQQLEGNLLNYVANQYGFASSSSSSSSVCEQSPNTDHGMWLVRVSSLPHDTRNNMFQGCFELKPDSSSQSCVSYFGHMSGTIVGPRSEAAWVEVVAKGMRDGSVTDGTNLRVSYLGTVIDGGSYNGDLTLPPLIVDPERKRNAARPVLLTLGALLLILGIITTMYVVRRRRHYRQEHNNRAPEVTMATEGENNDSNGNNVADQSATDEEPIPSIV